MIAFQNSIVKGVPYVGPVVSKDSRFFAVATTTV